MSDPSILSDAPPVRVPLHNLHVALGGKIVPFAGYELPVHYSAGILAEHLHTRRKAGLFDVSHMGQAKIVGSDRVATHPFHLDLAKLGLKGPEAGKDLWTGKDVTLTDNQSIELGSHDILLVRVASPK